MLFQNLVEVKGALAAGRKSARHGQIVLSDDLSLSALGVPFHVHTSQGAFRSCQIIFLCRDDAFPAFQQPLPGKELLPQFDDNCCRSHHA
jgi:hypothetical protein